MKLTMPSTGEPGRKDIRVDGRKVGHAVQWSRYGEPFWEACLWPAADVPPTAPHRCELVTRIKIDHLRRDLQQRLNEYVPWWTDGET